MLLLAKAGNLAMETLLGLTSKRAGDWMKEELRRIKGIDFILDTVLKCALDDTNEGFMVKIDRCMHVLENVSTSSTINNALNVPSISGDFQSLGEPEVYSRLQGGPLPLQLH